MTLWISWMHAVRCLRPACSRSRTFLWMVLVLMGLCCRMSLSQNPKPTRHSEGPGDHQVVVGLSD